MRCGRCGEVIGIYEPLVLAHEGLVRATSVAGEPQIAAEAGERFHRACYPETSAGSTAETGATRPTPIPAPRRTGVSKRPQQSEGETRLPTPRRPLSLTVSINPAERRVTHGERSDAR
jgi:hypothetical protein